MRRIFFLALALALLVSLAACGDGGETEPTPEGPTTLSLTKTMVKTSEGEFRFTLELTNEGGNAAVAVTVSDVWEEGLEVTDIEPVDGQQPEDIGDFGLELILGEFPAGNGVELEYTARCRQSGEWQNTAAASSANAEAVDASLSVACP